MRQLRFCIGKNSGRKVFVYGEREAVELIRIRNLEGELKVTHYHEREGLREYVLNEPRLELNEKIRIACLNCHRSKRGKDVRKVSITADESYQIFIPNQINDETLKNWEEVLVWK